MPLNRTFSRHYTARADETDITAFLKCAAARVILFSVAGFHPATEQELSCFFLIRFVYCAFCCFSGLFFVSYVAVTMTAFKMIRAVVFELSFIDVALPITRTRNLHRIMHN